MALQVELLRISINSGRIVVYESKSSHKECDMLVFVQFPFYVINFFVVVCFVPGSYFFLTAFISEYFVVFSVDEITCFSFAFLDACLLCLWFIYMSWMVCGCHTFSSLWKIWEEKPKKTFWF